MLCLEKKLPRGIIYHDLSLSLNIFVKALFGSFVDFDLEHRLEVEFASLCERSRCVAFPHARSAVYSILKAKEFKRGLGVIMPPITIKGILDAVVHAGLRPVFVEMDAKTMSFDLEDLAAKLDDSCCAAIITPLFGLVPDMRRIQDILSVYNVYTVIDFSQCLNGRFDGKNIASFGDVAVYSASSIKTLDTVGGGLVVTDDENLVNALKCARESFAYPGFFRFVFKAWINLFRNCATSQPQFSCVTFPALSLLRLLNPSKALKQTGNRSKRPLEQLPAWWFGRLNVIQCNVGLSQIKKVKSADRRRIRNAETIKRMIGEDFFPATTSHSENVYWQLISLVPDAKKAQKIFASQGIDVATTSLELISELPEYEVREFLPIAKNIHSNGIFLPCFPGMNEQDIERVVGAYKMLLVHHKQQ